MNKIKIQPKFVISDGSSDILCVRFSPDHSMVAAAVNQGGVRIYNTTTGALVSTIAASEEYPITQFRWRPHSEHFKTKNVLVLITTSGKVQHWHVSSGKLLSEIEDPSDQLLCIDFSPDGQFFAVGGKNREIRIYDEKTKKLTRKFAMDEFHSGDGHSNRIFCVRISPVNPNILVSGSWDKTIKIWNIEEKRCVKTIYGTFICGDSLDISPDGKTLLAGSWRTENQLQLYKMSTGELLQNIEWISPDAVTNHQEDGCKIYACQFSRMKDRQLLIAGGCDRNEVKVYDRESQSFVGGMLNLTKGCYSLDISSDGTMLAVGGGDGTVKVVELS